jgi:hypothetical protein
VRRVAATVLATALLATACGSDDDTGASGPTTAAETTSTTAVDPSRARTLVLASPGGVELVSESGRSTTVSNGPASSAYAVGAELVVFQGTEPGVDVFPPSVGGPITVWSGGGTRELGTDPAASRVFLLDAALVDGAPVALVAERFGEVAPEDTFEVLVRIDLRDDSRTTISRRPAWESGHFAARLLPDGDAVGLLAAEAQLLLTRWSPGASEARWTVEVGVDTTRDLTLRDVVITLIEATFEPGPRLRLTTIDEASGDATGTQTVDVQDPSGEIASRLVCRDWRSGSTLLCGRASGGAVSIAVDDGGVDQLAGAEDAIPTVARTS